MRVGIDEAGRGPVLGPMVCAAVGVPRADALPDGVADSKRLAPERREELSAAIRADDRIAVGVAAVGVERIDDPDTDMNRLTVAGQAEAASALLDDDLAADGGSDEVVPADGEDDAVAPVDGSDGIAPAGSDEVSILADAGDTSEERFARRLADAIDDSVSDAGGADRASTGDLSVDARHGADDADPVVAAASIVAKVERDARVADLAAEYGDVGSGYPSDPTTRAFLEAFVEAEGTLPNCARRTWRTCDDVLADVEQSGLGEY